MIFLLVDTDGRIVRFNASAEELFGFADDDAGARQALVGRLPPGGEPRGRADLLPPHERGRRGAARRDRLDRRRRTADLRLGRRTPGGRRRGPPPLPDLRPGSDGARRAARRDRGAARLPLGGQPRDAEPAHRRRARRHDRARGRQLRVPRAHGLRRRGRDRQEVLGSRRAARARRRGAGGVRGAGRERASASSTRPPGSGATGNWRIIAWWLRPLLGGRPTSSSSAAPTSPSAKAQEAELRASRARIVEAGDDERRRLERNLHDGAQQRLVSLSLALRLAQAKLRDDPDGADADPHRAPARSSRTRSPSCASSPAASTRRCSPTAGSAAALEALAARAPLPVELAADLDERLPGPVEAAAYYVVAEALDERRQVRRGLGGRGARAAAERPRRRRGRRRRRRRRRPALGSGLRGLADRVEALDGELEVESAAGAGTTVRAVIPLSPP